MMKLQSLVRKVHVEESLCWTTKSISSKRAFVEERSLKNQVKSRNTRKRIGETGLFHKQTWTDRKEEA